MNIAWIEEENDAQEKAKKMTRKELINENRRLRLELYELQEYLSDVDEYGEDEGGEDE